MAFIKRIFLFGLVNVLVVVTISIVTSLLGLNRYSGYEGLMAFCLLWGMGGAFISLMLSRIMAKWMMGVQVIDPNTPDPALRSLVYRVHTMAKSGGMDTMPEVGIYESPEVNAFATGPTKNRALVACSTGLLNTMSDDEVDGVLGHEITHITNGDMVTMTLIQGVVNAFVMFLARIIAALVSATVDERMRYMVRFAVTIVLEIALSFLGMMVVAYFSRRREFRADAGGAKLAGRDKMIRALEKLRRTYEINDPNAAQSVQTLKISGKQGGLMALLATHPPLELRIERLQRGNY